MHVTVIGHSCLRIKTRAGTVLIDPWLSGSCYWRSWWHFPPSAEPDAEMFSPDWIYLTHHHFDHFHYPSMRRMDRSAKVMIPRFGVQAMVDEVKSLGFESPQELAHGRVVELDAGVRVASYQYGFDDTTFVVAEDGDVVIDINDCKIRRRSLSQIRREFGRPTLACKSHSFAQSYPVLYESEDPEQLRLVSRDSYIDDFHDVMSGLQPRFAVPFGSMVGFLHPDSRPVNEHLVTPHMVVDGVAERGGIEGTEVITMAPGDSWDSEAGFTRSDADWYSDRCRHLEDLLEVHGPKIDERKAQERGVTVDWGDFEPYLSGFVREVPRVVGRRLAPRPFVFYVPSDEVAPYWWVSFRSRSVGRSATPPADRSGLTTVPEAVLAEAIRDRILHLVHGSMRIRTALAPDGVRSDLGFWGLAMIWELGYLPLRRSVRRRRFWSVLLRRRRELIEQIPILLLRNPVDRLAERFGAEV